MVTTDMCGKSPSRGNEYIRLRENIRFQQFCLFLTFSGVFIIILILLFSFVYILFLALLSSFYYLLLLLISLVSLLALYFMLVTISS